MMCTVPLITYAQDQEESEELEEVKVIGRYLHTDQVMALKTPNTNPRCTPKSFNRNRRPNGTTRFLEYRGYR